MFLLYKKPLTKEVDGVMVVQEIFYFLLISLRFKLIVLSFVWRNRREPVKIFQCSKLELAIYYFTQYMSIIVTLYT